MSCYWKELVAHKTAGVYEKIINIGDSLWYSTSYKYGGKGMVEYCIKTNTIKQIVQYPEDIQPTSHTVCAYHNIIYIIDGWINGNIISFDVSTKQFKKQLEISKIGGW
eukprot:64653_1